MRRRARYANLRQTEPAVNRPSSQYEYMSLDDFEELLADKPADEKWELISGRVVRMMVGARQEHNRICQNIATAMMTDLRRKGSDCRPSPKPSGSRKGFWTSPVVLTSS